MNSFNLLNLIYINQMSQLYFYNFFFVIPNLQTFVFFPLKKSPS